MNCDYKRFHVLARRKIAKSSWTAWTRVDNFDDAMKQAKKAEAAGFELKIVDKGERE